MKLDYIKRFDTRKTAMINTRMYPVVIHREAEVWGYHSPEFGGGGAASHDEALRAAQELLKSAAAEFREQGEAVPLPTKPDLLDADGGQIAWLPVVVAYASIS